MNLNFVNLFKSKKLLRVFSSLFHFRPIHHCVRAIGVGHLNVGLVDMPKDYAKPREQLRNVRLKSKAASLEQLPSECILTVLGNGGNGNPRCLYVFTDHKTYIFNCGEGTQRLSSEYKLKLSKLEHVFFTYKSWQNIGGLPGLSLTIQSIGVPNITLHGPPGIKAIYSMASDFMLSRDLMVFQSLPEEKTFTDSCMDVRYVLLRSGNPSSSKYLDTEPNIVNAEDTEFTLPNKPAKKTRLSYPKEDVAVAYICKLQNKPGKLCLESCLEHNVPPGPLLGLLKSGKDVTLPDGKIVKSSDVVSPEEPGQIFIVVECPHRNFLASLMSNKLFQDLQDSSDEAQKPAVVVHFTPPEVVADPVYQKWMNKFPETTHHMILNSDCSSLSSVGVHRIQNMLHLLHPRIFPDLSQPVLSKSTEGNNRIVYADTMLKFSLRSPSPGLDTTVVAAIDREAHIQEAKESPDFEESLNDFLTKIPKINLTEPESKLPQGGEVIFMGTGSSIPSKVRNVSSILWNYGRNCRIMFDCGEGTYGQLVHFYGHQVASDVLLEIKLIFLSHLHADHHMGLIEILLRRAIVFKECSKPYLPVDILAPLQIIRWLTEYHNLFEPILHLFRLIPAKGLVYNKMTIPNSVYISILQSLHLKQLTTVCVQHCNNAFGIVVKSADDWKMVYSGDTMPCEDLVKAGQSCSLLIHEATMEDNLKDEAVLKRHSTTSEAIDIGRRMNAKFTLLTHFSQRYGKVPLFNENFGNTVGCAFDNMRVSQKELPILPLMIPCLKNLFHEHYENMEEKTAKKCLKRNVLKVMANENIQHGN